MKHRTLRLQLLALSLVGILILVGSIGIGVSMAQDHTGAMTGCPLMNGNDTMCPMGVMEHLQQWRALFTATHAPDTTLLGIILVMLWVGLGAMLVRNMQLVYKNVIHVTLYQLQNPEHTPDHYLLVAFSQGILNPKIF